MTDNEMLDQAYAYLQVEKHVKFQPFLVDENALAGLLNAIKKPGSGVVKPR